MIPYTRSEYVKENDSRRLHRRYFEPIIIFFSQPNTVYMAWIRKASVHKAMHESKFQRRASPGIASDAISTCTQHSEVSMLPQKRCSRFLRLPSLFDHKLATFG